MRDTRDADYARRLQQRECWWERILNVHAPYQWNLRRQDLGRTLDIGCGIGRNMVSLPAGSVGVEHNAAPVAEAPRLRGNDGRAVGASPMRIPESFDGLLLAHVIKHMDEARPGNS